MAETSYQKSQVFKSFCYRERALIQTCLIKITVLTFLVNQKYNETLWGIYFWRLREKTFSQIAYSLPFSNLKLSNVILSKVSGTVLYVCYTEMSSNKHLKTPPFLFVSRRACPGGQPICSLLFTFNLSRLACVAWRFCRAGRRSGERRSSEICARSARERAAKPREK